MKKYLAFIIPGIIIIPFGYYILRPGIFNFIPFSIHEAFFRGLIEEYKFVIVFDTVILILLYLFLFKLVKRKMKNAL